MEARFCHVERRVRAAEQRAVAIALRLHIANLLHQHVEVAVNESVRGRKPGGNLQPVHDRGVVHGIGKIGIVRRRRAEVRHHIALDKARAERRPVVVGFEIDRIALLHVRAEDADGRADIHAIHRLGLQHRLHRAVPTGIDVGMEQPLVRHL